MSIEKKNNAAWPSFLNTLNPHEQHKIFKNILPNIKHLLLDEKIPLSNNILNTIQKLYIPFAHWLVTQPHKKPLVVGISGSQGSGKSTLNIILSLILEQCFQQKVVSFSIDDLYKTQQQRHELADKIHPLLLTRGVPGTHNVDLGISLFKQLTQPTSSHCQIPVFDKTSDNPLPTSQWTSVNTDCDIILFEGWCVGATAQTENELIPAINSLEENEDKTGCWRRYVNRQLQTTYAELFAFIDIQLLLKIPDFNKVLEWRGLQEKKLIDKNKKNMHQMMNEAEIKHFIMHFERLTKHMLNKMPEHGDVIFELDTQQQTCNVITNR